MVFAGVFREMGVQSVVLLWWTCGGVRGRTWSPNDAFRVWKTGQVFQVSFRMQPFRRITTGAKSGV